MAEELADRIIQQQFRGLAVSPVETEEETPLASNGWGRRLGEGRPKLTLNCRNYLEFVGMLAALFVWMKNNGFANINPVGLIMRAICDCFRLKTKNAPSIIRRTIVVKSSEMFIRGTKCQARW